IASTLTFTIPAAAREGKKLWVWQLLFGTGRVSTYMVLGAGAGALGDRLLKHLSSEHYHWPALLSGIIMLLLAVQLLGKSNPLVRIEKIGTRRSEEHTSELQSRFDLVCCLLLEK